MRASLLALSLLLSSAAYAADTPAGDVPKKEAKPDAAKPEEDNAKASVQEDAQPVRRSIPLNGHTLAYTVTPGHLTIRNDEGEPIASMFYVAYTAPSAGRPRPVTFLFNGGPGSSSMWLHLGSFGPMKIDASLPQMERPAPFRMVANPDTLLDTSDLVFIDAPTTGLSRALGKAETKDLVGVDHDLDAFTRTIQRYLTVYGRWNSPKFIIGESYGTLRAAGLSHMLADKGVQLNGITLVSTVLDIGLLFGTYDQGYVNILPTYAAAAWYHDKVAGKPPLEASFRKRGLCPRPLCGGAAAGQRLERGGASSGRRRSGALHRPHARLFHRQQPPRRSGPLPQGVAAQPGADHRPPRRPVHRERAPTLPPRARTMTRRTRRSRARGSR